MLLQSERIKLRALEPEDLDVLYKWENDTSLWSRGIAVTPYSRYQLKQYISSSQDLFEVKQLRLMIELKNSSEVIGTVDLFDFDPQNRRSGVGVLIDNVFQGKGYASEAIALLCEYSFSFLKIHQLYVYIPVKNEKSLNLFRNSGFKEAGSLSDWLLTPEGYEDVLIFNLISDLSDN